MHSTPCHVGLRTEHDHDAVLQHDAGSRPTLVVTEGQTVTVTLTNALPTAAGNTSILFPGFTLTSTCPAANRAC